MNRNIIFLIIIFILNSCFAPEEKKPKFIKPFDSISTELKEITEFKKVNIKWDVYQMSDTVSHYLKVYFADGENLPKDDSSLRIVGKEIIYVVANSIDNITDYSNLQVIFTKETEKNGPFTYNEMFPFKYSLEDLQTEKN